MQSLVRFYRESNNMEVVLPIIQGNSPTPLRLFNWFVTNYCKERNLIICNNINGGDYYVNVYMEYRTQLKTFSKQQFDPFRRDNKRHIIFNYDPTNPEKRINTTVGQLNFFRWALEIGVVSYVKQNRELLEHEMKKSIDSDASVSLKGEESLPEKTEKPGHIKTRSVNMMLTFD